MPHSIRKLDFAGESLNIYLAKLMAKVGICLASSELMAQTVKIKEECCYMSLDPVNEVVRGNEVVGLDPKI
jgi:hypothetical protein